MKYIQSSVKTMLFYLPLHYKSDTTRKRLSIKIYTRGPPHELYLIALMLQGQIIIGLTKKIVISYVVGDLILLD